MVSQSKTVPESIIQIKNVTVDFGGFKALNDLTFSVERGELRVVIGPNGAGKTVLLDVITGKVRPTTGQVLFQPDDSAQRDITGMAQETIANLGIGRKFQTPNVFNSKTVMENMQMAIKYSRGVWATLMTPFSQNGKEHVTEILNTIGLASKANRLAGILSHGEKQWLELGMVMAQDPDLLLIDEPVAGMTPGESEKTGELLLTMSKKRTLIVIDHDMTFVKQIAKQVTVLDEGQVLFQGTVKEVQENPKVVEVYLGGDCKSDSKRPAIIDPCGGDRCRTPSDISESSHSISAGGTNPILSIEQLSVAYGETLILRDINMGIQTGDLVLLMGRNGVGKTTLLKSLMGLLHRRSGRIVFEGQDLTHSSPDFRARAGIGYVPQGREIFPQLTVLENLQVGMLACGRIHAVPDYIFDWFKDLNTMLDRKGCFLSGGQQQLLAIARALVAEPRLLILDEPSEGIQPNFVTLIAQCLTQLKSDLKMSVLLVEQYLAFDMELADHYYVMEKGAIVLSGGHADIDKEKLQPFLVF